MGGFKNDVKNLTSFEDNGRPQQAGSMQITGSKDQGLKMVCQCLHHSHQLGSRGEQEEGHGTNC